MHPRSATRGSLTSTVLRLGRCLVMAGLLGIPGVAVADGLVAQRFASERPDAELESILYLSTAVALADRGYSSARSSAGADYILLTEYAVRGSEADIRLSLVAAEDESTVLGAVDALLHLSLSFDDELSEALARLVERAGLVNPDTGGGGTRIGGLFSSELITVADTLRTKQAIRIEALGHGGGMYFVGDFSAYARFGAGATVDAGVLFIKPAWSASAGLRASTTRAFLSEGVAGGDLLLSTVGLDLRFGVGSSQALRLSACASGGAALVTVVADSGTLTKAAPYADAGLQAGFNLGKDFFLGGDIRYLAIFEGSVVIMAIAPTVTICKEF